MSEYNYIRKRFVYDGQSYRVRGKTEEEVNEKIAQKIRELSNGGISEEITVKQWAEMWMETYLKPKIRKPGKAKERGTMTAKSFQMYPEKMAYILPAIGHMEMRKVRDIHLQQLLNKQARSKAHVQKLRLVIKGMFSQAYASRVIEWDPSTKLTIPAAEEGSRRSLTDYEREILLEIAKKHRSGLWIRTLLRTGMRPGESAALRVKNVDIKNGVIHIVEALESGSGVISPPKSKAGIRDVPIIDDIKEDLKTHIKDKGPEDFVFTQENGTRMTQTVMSNNWRSFSRQMDLAMGAETTMHGHIYDPSDLMEDGTPIYPDPADPTKPRNGHKIAPDLVLYCLRHTFCTDMKKAGVPLATAKIIMGHEDITTTANIYMDTYQGETSLVAELMRAATGPNEN